MPPARLPAGTVTFLFTDIEGSTRLWETQPEAMKVSLARHDALMRETIGAANGYVFKTVGDAFCAAFASASQAVEAVLATQLALVSETWPAETPIRVRMALHTGAVESRDDALQGWLGVRDQARMDRVDAPGTLIPRARASGEIGRRAGFRFQSRKG